MPLWGVGEYRDKNLSQHRSGSESVETGEVSTNDVSVTTCTHGPGGAPDPDHVGFFYHVEPPIWQINRDANGDRQLHMRSTTGDLGHDTADEAWTTTLESGPPTANQSPSEDPMGDGVTLESNRNAADSLSQTVGRGGSARALPDDNGNYPNRLISGSRGQGYHYEYEYIDSNGNHRRRHEHLVATRRDLSDLLDPDVVNVDWNQSDSTT